MPEEPEQPDTRAWYTFVDDDERAWWVAHHATAWAATLTLEEEQAVQAYQSPQHRAIQGVLRGDTEAFDPEAVAQALRHIPHLDSAIYKGEINTDVVLYRGFGSHRRPLRFEVGKQYSLPTYMSLSADPGWALRFLRIKRYTQDRYLAEVRVPNGTPAGFLTQQLEVILERDTMFRVVALRPPLAPDGPHRITLEVTT